MYLETWREITLFFTVALALLFRQGVVNKPESVIF